MTIKVNKYVMFFNDLNPNKKFVNQHIKRLASYNTDVPIYQKNLKNGSTVLSATIPEYKGGSLDEFIVVNKDGTYFEKNITKHSDKVKYFWNKVVRFCDKDGWVQNSFIKNKFFNGKKLEESAFREVTKDDKVNIGVRSIFGRKSEFPQTQIARNLRTGVFAKSTEANGDTIYRENYLSR